MTAISTNDVWAIGDGAGTPFSIHWDGTSWTQVTTPKVGAEDYIHGIDASSSTDVWAVGESTPNYEDWRALAMRWNGLKWAVAKTREKPSLDTHFLGGGRAWPGERLGRRLLGIEHRLHVHRTPDELLTGLAPDPPLQALGAWP